MNVSFLRVAERIQPCAALLPHRVRRRPCLRSRDCAPDVFDRHINSRQLQECLLGVLRLQGADGDRRSGPIELRERLEAVHLLVSLPHGRHMDVRWLRPQSR